jgi:RNA polymerase sigma-70 factor (ECF subfamily)
MAPDEPTSEVAERVRIGERSGEADLVRRFYRSVYAMVVARIGDPDAARDLTQEVMFSVLVALREGRLENPQGLTGYICGTMRNQVRYYFRSQHPERRAELSGELSIDQPDPEEMLASTERRALANRAISKLGPNDQKILRLTLVEGLTPLEIGERLQLKPEVVRKRKSRALRRLRKILREGRSRV